MLTLFIILSFALSSNAATIKKKNGAVATEDIDDMASNQPKTKVDKSVTDTGKGKIQSKDVKGKTETNASQKTDKTMGESVSAPRLPPIGPIGPPGKSTNTSK